MGYHLGFWHWLEGSGCHHHSSWSLDQSPGKMGCCAILNLCSLLGITAYIYIHSEIEANIWRSIINHPYIYLNDTWKCCRIDTCFKSWSSLSRSASSSGWKHWPIVWSTPSCKLAQLHRFEHEVAMPMKTNTPTLPKWSKWLNQISSLDMMIKRWNQQSMVLFVHAECSK